MIRYLILFLFIIIQTQPFNITIPLPFETQLSTNKHRELCHTIYQTTETQCYNWARTKNWKPSHVFMPEDEQQLSEYLENSENMYFKIVGYGHSWAGLYIPPMVTIHNESKSGATIALHKLSGITQLLSDDTCLLSPSGKITKVEVFAGTSFAKLHKELDDIGLSLSWQSGGIQGLTVGGAISVGFHGSQISSSSISSVVSAMTIYDTKGQSHLLEYHHEKNRNSLMMAARLGLGVCGIMTRVTLPVEPRFYLRRRRWKLSNIPLFLSKDLTSLKLTYDRFHYYIHPHTNSVWPMYWENTTFQEYQKETRPCRTAQEQWEDEREKEYGKDGLPLIMRWDNCSDVSFKAYTHAIDMEAQPLWNGEWFVNLSDKEEGETILAILEIFQNIAQQYESDHKPDIDLWLHIRYMRGDEIYLHPCYGWEVCAGFELALVAKGMNDPLPSEENWYRYYHPMEEYLKSKKGRPHWAKDHTSDAEYISKSGLKVSKFLQECQVFNLQNSQGFHVELWNENHIQ
jgi:FAD binding domain/D-arabinono-1,4-lactone oxidase